MRMMIFLGSVIVFTDGDLDTKWELLDLFESDLNLTGFPKVVSARKLPYTTEGGARVFIDASLEEQGESEKGRGRSRGRGRGRGRGKSRSRGRGRGRGNSKSKSKSKGDRL